jgi:isopentenyl-diphosphate delta-isomerase
MTENDELLDLADTDDNVTGTIRRGDLVQLGYKTPLGYARFANAFLLNDAGQIWVPIRGLHKKVAPGGCDFSVGEHVQSGESYEHAIERGFLEEAGLEIEASELLFIGKLAPTDEKPAHEAIYACFMSGRAAPRYSREEFTSASWLSLAAFETMLASGPPAKSSLLPSFKLLQAALARRST